MSASAAMGAGSIPPSGTRRGSWQESSSERGLFRMPLGAERGSDDYIVATNLRRIFGPDCSRASKMLDDGWSKEAIARETENVVAVADVSLSVGAGELFVVMGLSGSGKSTLVRLLNRLIEPSAGTIRIAGRDMTALTKKELRSVRSKHLSMVFQSFCLLPHRTVLENVAFGLELQRVPKAERVAHATEVLRMVGLEGWGHRQTQELSGGMQQRVGLARALATDADILLMDEPFSALDPLVRNEMQTLTRDLQQRLKKTIIFITHDLNEAMLLGDKIAIMKDGVMVQIGTVEQILNEPADAYVRFFTRGVDRSRVLTANMVAERPRAISRCNDTPRAGLDILERHGQRKLYILDEADEFVGWSEKEDLLRAASRGDSDLRQAVKSDWSIVSPTIRASELLALVATESRPVVVESDDRSFVGIISPPGLLSALAGSVKD